MSKTVVLEVTNTGNHTANLILLLNQWIKYAENKALLSPMGIERVIKLFESDSTLTHPNSEMGKE